MHSRAPSRRGSGSRGSPATSSTNPTRSGTNGFMTGVGESHREARASKAMTAASMSPASMHCRTTTIMSGTSSRKWTTSSPPARNSTSDVSARSAIVRTRRSAGSRRQLP